MHFNRLYRGKLYITKNNYNDRRNERIPKWLNIPIRAKFDIKFWY
jgi:hypothetical protein